MNNLRVVGKAPRAALRRLKIHKATGKNVANPRAGRCRCIFDGRAGGGTPRRRGELGGGAGGCGGDAEEESVREARLAVQD